MDEQRKCNVGGCRVGEEFQTESGESSRRMCARYRDGQGIIDKAHAAGALLFVETIRRETPFMSDPSSVDGPVGVCWAWEEFLIASGIGREEGGLGSRRGMPFNEGFLGGGS